MALATGPNEEEEEEEEERLPLWCEITAVFAKLLKYCMLFLWL